MDRHGTISADYHDGRAGTIDDVTTDERFHGDERRPDEDVGDGIAHVRRSS